VPPCRPAVVVVWPHLKAGTAPRPQNDLPGALADYNRGLGLDRKLAWAYAGRGLVHLAEKREAESAADFRRALELEPSLKQEIDEKVAELRAGK